MGQTVSGTLKMFDAMTGPLKNITNSMNLMLSTMHKMQSAANKDVKMDQTLRAAKQQLATAEASIRKEIDNATRSQERFNRAADKASSKGGKFASTLKAAAAAYLSLAAAKALINNTIVKAAEQQTVLDTLAARTGNRDHGQAIFDAVTQQALKYGQDVKAALAGSQSFMSATMNPKTLTQLNMLAMRLSKLNPGEGLEGAVFSLKELLSGDYTSIAERFNISRSMLKNSDARKAGMKGDVEGFIKGMDKLLNQQNMTQKAFEKMLDSPAAKWNRILETLKFKMASAGRKALNALNPLLNMLNKFVTSKSFDGMMRGLEEGLAVVAKLLTGIVDGAKWLVQVIRDNWPIVAGILGTIVGYFTIIAIQQIPVLVARFLTMISSLWAMIPPILAQAAAWLAANWYIALAAVAIGLLVAALVHFGVSVQEVVGYVTGAFYTMYATIHNQVALLWNVFASFAEFLINLFIDPVYAVKKLFYDLATTFGNYIYNMSRSAEDFAGTFVKAILKAVNKAIEGFNWLTEKVNGTFGTDIGKMALLDENNVHIVSDSLKSMMDMLDKPTSTKNVVSIKRMEQMNLSDSFKKGYSAGYGFTDKALKKISSLTSAPKKFTGNFDTKNTIPNVDKVNKVGKVEKPIDINSEDLKMLRELAEIKSIRNFVTMTPTVNLSTGPVNKGADVDEILERINTTLQEEIASAAAGVYP